MKVIKVELKNNCYIVESINTGNFIDDDNILYFSYSYIKYNKENVRKLFDSYEVDSVVYLDFDSFLVISDVIRVKNIKFDVDKSLTRKALDKLLTLDVKSVECFFMPSDYVHELSKRKVAIVFSNDMQFDKDFILFNNFKNLKSIYYRKKISFYNKYVLINNFDSFLKVNNSLRLIELYFYDRDSLDFIIDELNKYKFNNVSIYIHQNEDNVYFIKKDIDYLRKVSKKYSNDEREIKLIYSNEYFSNRIFKELTINGLKLCMIFLMYVSLFVLVSSKYHEYVSYLNLRKLESDISYTPSVDEVDDVTDIEDNEEVSTIYINKYLNIPKVYDKLLSINKDVVGWLIVNNTKINYPVVQTNDNEYYLSHDIYSNQIRTGWVFMDYRNNSDTLDKNTIIYGHNLKSGYMFGELLKTLNSNWYNNIDNQYIVFNTINKDMKWKVFSIYKTENTNDYLKTNFSSDEEYQLFIDSLKEKSITDFNVNVSSKDNILTLSTCSGINRRLVVHAVLVN